MKVKDPIKFILSVLRRDRPKVTEITGFDKNKAYMINLEFNSSRFSPQEAQQFATTLLESFQAAGITVLILPRYDNLIKVECSEISSGKGLNIVQ